jgi:hypothetical protein
MEGFIVKRRVYCGMATETTPDDLTAQQLYDLLTENPDQDEFTPGDMEEARR